MPRIPFLLQRLLAVRCARFCAHSFSNLTSHHVLCDSQTKLKRKAEGEAVEEERLSCRPAWVVDHNLCHLWSKGMDESMLPKELRLTPEALAQIKRLQLWAEEQVAQLEQEQGQQEQPLPPPPAPLPTVPTIAAAAFVRRRCLSRVSRSCQCGLTRQC